MSMPPANWQSMSSAPRGLVFDRRYRPTFRPALTRADRHPLIRARRKLHWRQRRTVYRGCSFVGADLVSRVGLRLSRFEACTWPRRQILGTERRILLRLGLGEVPRDDSEPIPVNPVRSSPLKSTRSNVTPSSPSRTPHADRGPRVPQVGRHDRTAAQPRVSANNLDLSRRHEPRTYTSPTTGPSKAMSPTVEGLLALSVGPGARNGRQRRGRDDDVRALRRP